MPPKKTTKKKPASLILGITAIRLIVNSGHSWGITDLAKELKLPKSSTHRLIRSLVELNFVQQNPSTKRYSISVEIFSFIHDVAAHFARNISFDKRLREAAHKHQCSVYICMLGQKDSYVICGAGDEGNMTRLGMHGYAYETSAGKVLIACQEESEWHKFAPATDDQKNSSLLENNYAKFHEQLEKAKKTGIAWNYRASSKDHVSVATIVREPFIETPRLAVALVLRSEKMYNRDHKELETVLLKLARDLEHLLGQR